MNKSQILEDRLKKLSIKGQISCGMLRKIAEETGISYKFAGKAANQLKIKIKNCDLGCF